MEINTSQDSSINLVFTTTDRNQTLATTNILEASVNEKKVETVIYSSRDINGDSQVGQSDLQAVAEDYNKTELDGGFNESLDVNKDGVIDIFDMILISKELENK